jgi:prepilin-type N-terminal cleavage/methylation domain-containing protein
MFNRFRGGKKRQGFTIVELIIVIAIMAILLTLGVVNLQDTLVNGRDDERKEDIANLARHLETFYTSGSDSSTTTGFYPSTAITTNASTMTTYLRDADNDTLMAPGITDPIQTVKAASDTSILTSASAHPTFSEYIYQPLALSADGSTWSLCTGSTECRKFNLYYRLESDNTVYIKTSINQ